MSGFEVAGLVLGAFPLAICALEKWREVTTRLGQFNHIRVQYKKVLDNLKIHQLTFKRHLRQLLLPMLVDDDKIVALLADPGGPSWKEQAVAELLEKRLQDSYPLYMSCIQGLLRVMEDISRELAMDSEAVQDKINTPRASTPNLRIKASLNKGGIAFQRYRLKFCNGETVRERLFKELEHYNDTLEKLLDSSDKDTQLVQTRLTTMRAASIDATICRFWIQAQKVWKALSAAWNCRCAQHEARLLLQHRTSRKFEVQIIFTKMSSSAHWEICKTRIAEEEDMVGTSVQPGLRLVDNVPIRQTKQSSSAPLKSALKGKSSTMTSVAFAKPLPSITFTNVQTAPHLPVTQPITNLCSVLDQQQDGSCCGYLPEDDCRYYVFTIKRQRAETVPSITLAEILKGEVLPQPSRTQRYIISLILASSFLQLLESPWMSATFKETEISFLSDPNDPSVFILDQPHITRDLPTATVGTAGQTKVPFTDALDQLGIILLELCFGKTLAEQPYRARWPAGQNEREKAVFDVMAARDWQCHVNEEAGLDYAEAVGWCLGGNRSAAPESWREDMLRKVIEPLQRCRDYLTGSGTT